MHNGFIILCLLTLTLNSCYNHIKNFTAFKYPPTKEGKNLCVETKGVYIGENGFSFFFYKDGIVKKVIRITTDNYNSKDYSEYETKEYWGHYYCEGGKIIIQTFNRHHQEIFKRWIIETQGRVLSNSEIEVFSSRSLIKLHKKDEEQYIQKPVIFKYYETDRKPDSSLAWFRKKNWYKENVFYNTN